MERERRVRPGCPNAGNPFHECGDYCAGGSHHPNPSRLDRGKAPATNGDGAIRNVNPNCVNAANPFHQCGDYCANKIVEPKRQSGSGLLPVLRLSPRSASDRSGSGRSAQSGKGVIVEGRNVDPNCVNASNPFHQCADYCSKKSPGVMVQSRIGKTGTVSKENVAKIVEGRKVDPNCVNASNPFHQCTENCQRRTQGAKRQMNGHTLGALLARENGEVTNRENREEEVLIRDSRKVDPRCPNASNPFHECAEYCVEKISGSERKEEGLSQKVGGKSDKSKGSAHIVTGIKDVDPRCVNASNPFHKCADYCFQRIHGAT